MRRIARMIAVACAFALMLGLAGCDSATSPLHRGLSETEANRLVSFLDRYEITAGKKVERDGVTVFVASAELARAARLSSRAGLPRADYKSFGAIFPKDGLISSPMEERARMTFAVSQQIEAMLADIDGVVSARVNVVIPERRNGRFAETPSAAVLIRYLDGLETDMLTNKIRRLVASSVPGLVDADPRQISISFVRIYQPDAKEYANGSGTDDTSNTESGLSTTAPATQERQLFGGWPYVFGIITALMVCGFIMRRQFMPPVDMSDEFELSQY
ncbi:MAG: type III secretion system inner membrane ring lipoprotein SctJ [Janthinobacterium lividum]